MENRLKRAARAAFKPNALMMGVATCVFGWAVAESMRPVDEYDHFDRSFPEELVFLSAMMLVAAVGLATKRLWGNLLAAVLSGPLTLLQLFIFVMLPSRFSGVTFLSLSHIERWLDELADMPASVWLMTVLSFAILSSATAATLRRMPSQS